MSKLSSALVPYHIHDSIKNLIDLFELSTFDIFSYVLDNFDDNYAYLKTLDPKEWMDNDHYAVLRLKKVRYNASVKLIKYAYRKLALYHHSDKDNQESADGSDFNNDYFVCVQKSYELLMDPKLRRAYDSMDPDFDDSIPTVTEVKNDFYNSLRDVFESNGRFSKKQPVPSLGDDNSDIDDVYNFYDFWDSFESWRDFTYTFESENKNRYERKEIEAEGKVKNKEDFARIRKLVDIAMKHDPRVKRDKIKRQEEKEASIRAKQERRLQRLREIEEARQAEQDRLDKEEALRKQQLQEQKAIEKKANEERKNLIKVQRKKLRNYLKSKNCFEEYLKSETSSKSLAIRKAETDQLVENLCGKFSIDELTDLNSRLDQMSDDKEALDLLKEEEQRNSIKSNAAPKPVSSKSSERSLPNTLSKCGNREWTFDLNQLLIRAINTHPPGTKHRWAVIAEFMNVHWPGDGSGENTALGVKEKQIIYRAKSLKSDDSQLRKEATANSLQTKADLKPNSGLSQKNTTDSTFNGIDKPDPNSGITTRSEAVTESLPWTMDEQKRLELALRLISQKESDRWQKISTYIGTRTKKECILRFKDLAEKLKAKKANESRDQ